MKVRERVCVCRERRVERNERDDEHREDMEKSERERREKDRLTNKQKRDQTNYTQEIVSVYFCIFTCPDGDVE